MARKLPNPHQSLIDHLREAAGDGTNPAALHYEFATVLAIAEYQHQDDAAFGSAVRALIAEKDAIIREVLSTGAAKKPSRRHKAAPAEGTDR